MPPSAIGAYACPLMAKPSSSSSPSPPWPSRKAAMAMLCILVLMIQNETNNLSSLLFFECDSRIRQPFRSLHVFHQSSPASEGFFGEPLVSERTEIEDVACVPFPPFGLQSFLDRKSTRLNSSHSSISYAVF